MKKLAKAMQELKEGQILKIVFGQCHGYDDVAFIRQVGANEFELVLTLLYPDSDMVVRDDFPNECFECGGYHKTFTKHWFMDVPHIEDFLKIHEKYYTEIVEEFPTCY